MSLFLTFFGTGLTRLSIDPEIWEFEDRTQRIWLKCDLDAGRERIASITFSHAGAILVSASEKEDFVRTWNIESGSLLHKIQTPNVVNVVGSPHHPFIIAGSIWDGLSDATLFDADSGKVVRLPETVRQGAVLPDGRRLTAGGNDGGLTTLDIRPILEDQEGWSSDGVRLSSGAPPNLTQTTVDGPQVGLISSAREVDTHARVAQSTIDSLSVSPDGHLAASASSENSDLVLWDLASGQPMIKLAGNKLKEVCGSCVLRRHPVKI